MAFVRFTDPFGAFVYVNTGSILLFRELLPPNATPRKKTVLVLQNGASIDVQEDLNTIVAKFRGETDAQSV